MPEVVVRAEELKVRRAARVLVIDPEGKVLLFEYSHSGSSEDALSDKGSYFTIPGGKALSKESFEECARRELEEETGITDKIPGLVLAIRQAPLMMSSGNFVLADEKYFAIFVGKAQALDTSRWSTREKQNIIRVFWCSPSELENLPNLWPNNLAEILTAAHNPENQKLPLSYKSEREQIGDVIVKVVY